MKFLLSVIALYPLMIKVQQKTLVLEKVLIRLKKRAMKSLESLENHLIIFINNFITAE
jgi:hypothetical protein